MIQSDERLEIVQEIFQYSGQVFKYNRVDNLDDLVNQVTDDEFNLDERIPYWAELWPSAIGLSRFLIKNGEHVNGKSVLELGCGLGLSSMAIASQNPASLLVSDYEKEALILTEQNFRLNEISQPHTHLLDWRSPDLGQSFQRIVASDIVYEERFFHPLLSLFRNYLSGDGLIILAEPNRNVAGKFFEMLRNNGFTYKWMDEFVDQGKNRIRVTIYLIHR